VSGLDEAKQMCQSMSDCKAFWHCKKNCISRTSEVAYFYAAVGPTENAHPSHGGALYFRTNGDSNENNNDNDGPDLASDLGRQGGEVMQDLKKASELLKKKLDDVATKDDLKEAANKMEESFEEQLQEAGKHIMENRKLTKRVSDTLESIIKSKTSTARRRRRRKK